MWNITTLYLFILWPEKSFGHFESSNVSLLCRSSASWARRQIPPDAAALWLDVQVVSSASLEFPFWCWGPCWGFWVERVLWCPPVSPPLRRDGGKRVDQLLDARMEMKNCCIPDSKMPDRIWRYRVVSWLRITEKIGWWHFSWHEARTEMKHVNVQNTDAPCSRSPGRESGNLITAYSKTNDIQVKTEVMSVNTVWATVSLHITCRTVSWERFKFLS